MASAKKRKRKKGFGGGGGVDCLLGAFMDPEYWKIDVLVATMPMCLCSSSIYSTSLGSSCLSWYEVLRYYCRAGLFRSKLELSWVGYSSTGGFLFYFLYVLYPGLLRLWCWQSDALTTWLDLDLVG